VGSDHNSLHRLGGKPVSLGLHGCPLPASVPAGLS